MYLTNKPKIIESSFKYCSWDPNKDSSKNLKVLTSKKIRYNSIKSFNDEFDSKIVIRNDNGVVDNELTSLLINWIDSFRKVASFTLNPSSSLMWAHYASNNTGFMIEYKDLDLHKVNYSTQPTMYLNRERMIERSIKLVDQYNDTNISHEDIILNFFQTDHLILECTYNAFITKHMDWKYENEYRCFGDSLGEGFAEEWVLGDKVRNIESITFGTRFNYNCKNLFNIIENEVNNQNLKLYLAYIDYEKHIISRKKVTLKEFKKIIHK